MNRIKYLAAELFHYSYQNYYDHLGIGNERFERLMPDVAAKIEKAETEGWSDERLAGEIELDVATAREMRLGFANAVAVVDAVTAAAGLREGIRQSFDSVLGERQIPDHEIESFLAQACYRISDFVYRMEQTGANWRKASDELREEP